MNKPISIFALPSHHAKERTSGVDYLRIIQPMNYLKLQKGFEVTVWDAIGDTAKMEWPEIAKRYDIIYFNYLNNPWGFAAMGAMARKYGKKIVMDIDDNLWNILQDNTAYELFKKGSDGIKTITAIANEVDYITCTNQYLKNVIAHNTLKTHDKIQVFPNYIDLSFYNHIAKPKNTKQVNIGHFGSSTHFASLVNKGFVEAIQAIMDDYPNVTFTTIGSFFGEFKMRWGQRYIQKFGDVDITKWVKEKLPPFVDDIDFFVTPLEDNVYNRCKSFTKFNEVSSTKRPGIWQRIRQYSDSIEDNRHGLLATTTDEWYEKIKYLIDNPEKRIEMGEEAYKTVRNYTIQGHIQEYGDFFKRIV